MLVTVLLISAMPVAQVKSRQAVASDMEGERMYCDIRVQNIAVVERGEDWKGILKG